MKEAAEKVVHLLRHQTLHEDEHEETFYELFYDLILAVVFIKLSYLKYNMTFSGVLTVFVIYANFWSCYNLFVVYVSMFHCDDTLHRIYYIAHITTSVAMMLSIENPHFNFFNFKYMVTYHSLPNFILFSLSLRSC